MSSTTVLPEVAVFNMESTTVPTRSENNELTSALLEDKDKNLAATTYDPVAKEGAYNPTASALGSTAAPMDVLQQTTSIKELEATPIAKTSDVTGKSSSSSAPLVTDERKDEKTVEKPAKPQTPLEQLLELLPSITANASHSEMWGVSLMDKTHVPTTIVLEKFLRANSQDVGKAKTQLISALKWRKEMQPAKLLENTYDQTKFGGLGYVTTYQTSCGEKEIVTWNIYGAVKDKKATFGNIEEFIKWRCALMEISVQQLDLATKTIAIPEGGVDPYRMIQVHDYLSISFLRQDPYVKAATKETISTFSMAYPEMLKEKFFVNVPALMGWVFAGLKLVLAKETIKKFHVLSSGKQLGSELSEVAAQLPVAYGGNGTTLAENAMTPAYAGMTEPEQDTKQAMASDTEPFPVLSELPMSTSDAGGQTTTETIVDADKQPEEMSEKFEDQSVLATQVNTMDKVLPAAPAA